MGILDNLAQIRPAWLSRVSRSLARGESIRENLLLQLEQFYERLGHAADTGDPAWLDPILTDWVQARTQTELMAQETSLVPIISKLFTTAYELITESTSESDALCVITDMLPVYSYAVELVAQQEIQLRINHISGELEKANLALEKLEKSKSDFIAVAAHELKTPLTLIEGYTAMLGDQMPKDYRQSMGEVYLQGIIGGSRRLKEIVDDMVDVSMIDNNLLSINYQPVWLNHILDIIKNETGNILQSRSLTLKIHPFPGLDEMTFGDGERLLQALRNVISNSVKFTPDGGKITIDGRLLPGFIEMRITDTGIGIDPENHVRIFEKFGRLGDVAQHSSGKTKFKGGGPGLGLPIAKGIIEAHGGTIWVESEGYNETRCPGSTFHILLPLRQTPPDDKTAKLFQPIQEKRIIIETSDEQLPG
jgi:signal transduction histidine kinase